MIKEVADYYVQRLGNLYRTKPKAAATIALLAKQTLADNLVSSFNAGFDLDLAVGEQLDIIGKYVGVSRDVQVEDTRPYFGFVTATYPTEPQNPNGFVIAASISINADGVWYEAEFSNQSTTQLADYQYKQLLKIKISTNSSDNTMASLQKQIETFFNGQLQCRDNKDMTMAYYYSRSIQLPLSVLQSYLPRPMGVGITVDRAPEWDMEVNGIASFNSSTPSPSLSIEITDTLFELTNASDTSFTVIAIELDDPAYSLSGLVPSLPAVVGMPGLLTFHLIASGTPQPQSTMTIWISSAIGTVAYAVTLLGSVIPPPPILDPFVQFQTASKSGQLFQLPTGINEFDLVFDGANYNLFYDNVGSTMVRQATSVAGLAGAPDIAVNNGRYPSAIYEDGLWHLWNWWNPVTKHFTATTINGPWTEQDSLPANMSDVNVTKWSDGSYYSAYKKTNTSPQLAGILTSSSVNGPWTDMGLIFDTIGRVPYHALEEADGCLFEYNGQAYMSFAGWDGITQRICLVKIDITTGRATEPPVVIVNPNQSWEMTPKKVFNPEWFADGANSKMYYAHNAGAVPSGWGYIQFGSNTPDARRPADAVRMNLVTGMDLAAKISATLHGSGTGTANGLVTTSSEGGAYGYTNRVSLQDFELDCTFTANSLPSSYQRLLRLSKFDTNQNPVLSLWISPAGKAYCEIHDASGTGNLSLLGTAVFSTGVSYAVEIIRVGSTVTLYVNGVAEATGTKGTALLGFDEWSLSNGKGLSNPASQQFDGLISKAVITSP